MNKPLISIVIVVLNSADHIENAINSVLNQSLTDLELIILDGGSTDGTIDILKQYDAQIAYWESKPDHGIYDAMNKALSHCNGQWIYFLGADDRLYDSLAAVSNYLYDDATIYYGDVYRPGLGRNYDGQFSQLKLSFRNICHQSVFYPARLFDKHRFDLAFPLLSDYEFNMRVNADSDYQFEYIPITIALYNDIDGQSTANEDEVFKRNQLQLTATYFPRTIYAVSLIRFYVIKLLKAIRLFGLFKSIHNAFYKLTLMLKRNH